MNYKTRFNRSKNEKYCIKLGPYITHEGELSRWNGPGYEETLIYGTIIGAAVVFVLFIIYAQCTGWYYKCKSNKKD